MIFFRSVLLSLLFYLITLQTIAQESKLEMHYPGGKEQFWNDFKEHFQFPLSAVRDDVYGMSLIKLTLNSDGVPAEVHFLNQIDRDVIKSIIRSFTKLSHNWSAFPTNMELYISITFSYIKDYTQDINIDKSAITKDINEFTYIIDTKDQSAINYRKNYSQLVKAAKKAYKNSDFAAATQAYSRLISINPYQLDYYQKRVELEAFSGNKKYACTDIKVMKDMLNYQGSILLHGCN